MVRKACLLVLMLFGMSVGQGGMFFSGDGGIDDLGSAPAQPCIECLSRIRQQQKTSSNTLCNGVARLTECVESCVPIIDPTTDPDGIMQLKQLIILHEILATFRENDCEVYEELAPGCNEDILNCLVDTVTTSDENNLTQIKSFNCSDEAMIQLLHCTGKTPDCSWRTLVEMMASRAKRNVCQSNDKCVSGPLLFKVGRKCRTFRYVGLSGLDQLRGQSSQSTPPGTLFSVKECRLVHARNGVCVTES